MPEVPPPPAPPPTLRTIRGGSTGSQIRLAGAVTRIGRDAASELHLNDREASRRHAEIRQSEAGLWELVDLGSSNGTSVNGRRVSRHTLRHGDRIAIGGCEWIFGPGNAPPAPGRAAASDRTVYNVKISDTAGDASQIVGSLGPSRTAGDHATRTAANDEADRSLEVMLATAAAVGRTEDVDEVLDRVLQIVFDWVVADRGCIVLRDEETGRLQPAARCDRHHNDATQPAGGGAESPSGNGVKLAPGQIDISHTILDHVLKNRQGVRTSDAIGDDRFAESASLVRGGVREAMCVPLQGRHRLVGALYVDTYTPPGQWLPSHRGGHRFNDQHLRLITAIGSQAALAIEDTFHYSALMRSERLATMGQTIATLSHHIKNILQGVRGGSYLIDTGLRREDWEVVGRGWQIVQKNQERISHLVLDMLTYSKDRTPQRVDAEINDTVEEVVQLMRPAASQRSVRLQCCLGESMPPASIDPEMIHRAVLNLVTNGLDAAKSSVTVATRYDAVDGWTLEVCDDGEGIAVERRRGIFELFESTKGASGTGIGLPVTAKIIAEHGGTIDVGDAPGGGAKFCITLPHGGGDTIA